MISSFKPEDKVLILDFDHTCYDTDDFLLAEIRRPMLNRFNIPVESWEKSYKEAVSRGYSLEQHLEELTKIMKFAPCSLKDIKDFGEAINFNKYLYADCMPFLKKAKEKKYRIMVLSFGEVGWQNKKVFGVGLEKIVDVIEYVIVDENNSKAEAVKKYAGNCSRVIFVDNKGSNLDIVHNTLPNVETYLINRVPNDAMNFGNDDQIRVKYLESRRIAGRQSLFSHKHCSSFEDIILD
ncbi:MAG: HAD family hydrolase [Candidatus Paceibacterota bacterium]|jgi:FMN phosphatase YigB (HAD superfamily)